jgi:hypothetical protein
MQLYLVNYLFYCSPPTIPLLFIIVVYLGVRINLCVSRLILQTLKLTNIQASSDPEICEIRTGNLYEINLESDWLSYIHLYVIFVKKSSTA